MPSLLGCKALTISGPIIFSKGVIIRGSVRLVNLGKKALTLPSGAYRDVTINSVLPLYDARAFVPRSNVASPVASRVGSPVASPLRATSA